MKFIILIILFQLVGCHNQSANKNELRFLKLGVMLQNASDISFTKIHVPGIWSRKIVFKLKFEYCLMVKEKKGQSFNLRLVKKEGQGCSLSSDDIIMQLDNLQNLTILKTENSKILLEFFKQKQRISYSWVLLGLLNNNYIRPSYIECGGKNKPACYRGSSYKKNIITSCNTYNEQYFCSASYKLYCTNNKFSCL